MILQRASAGSGKTFKLAKTYIRLFISRRDNDTGRYMLLRGPELRENHAHILGVTFTNKATNEMKERIVNKLAALAAEHPEPGCESAAWKAPDYLKDFTGENPNAISIEDDLIFSSADKVASRAEIAHTCRIALQAMLNDYGNFNISTIDTFFQGVLRAFAYELRIGDNYHIELRDSYLAQVGVDHTLSLINNDSSRLRPEEAAEEINAANFINDWARTIIDTRMTDGENWNIFSKKGGIYSSLLDMAKKMNGEDFKLKANALADYFSDLSRFRQFYQACLEGANSLRLSHQKMKNQYYRLIDLATTANGCDEVHDVFNGMKKAFAAIEQSKPKIPIRLSDLGKKMEPYLVPDSEMPAPSLPNTFLDKNKAGRDDPALAAEFVALCRLIYQWNEQSAYWKIVLSRLHYLGVLYYIRRSSELFRLDNNIIPLSATNEILHAITNGDQTPFIYERIGTRLNHYLLDEFQDTSRMQWLNLHPLLKQSEDNGQECLIIGDAKQSIYRFRNAEPEIINSMVSAALRTRELPSPADPPAIRAAVNANWRSSRHVVLANNTIFTMLPAIVDTYNRPMLQSVYSSAVQKVVNADSNGYVDIKFDAPLGSEFAPADNDNPKKGAYSCLGWLIDDVRSRGYDLQDITILVNTNDEGTASVQAIMEHNRRMLETDASYRAIDILSDEALKVEDSSAVKIILAVLRVIARGFRHPEDADINPKTGEKFQQIKATELSQFVANFQCYHARHPEEPIEDIMRKDIDALLPPEEIKQMVEEMPSATLPAIVEEAAARFTSSLDTTQTAYIAAFQDAVLDYCENYPGDVASFLNWWDENSNSIRVAAPEGFPAVRVMTIHKSKGLESPVILIPQANWTLNIEPKKYKDHLLWVSHIPSVSCLSDCIPPFIPVTPDDSMSSPSSPFHEEFCKFSDDELLDNLNKTYVAFTRPRRELHVYAPIHKKLMPETVKYVGDYLHCALSSLAGGHLAMTEGLTLMPGDFTFDTSRFTAGAPTQNGDDKKHTDAEKDAAAKKQSKEPTQDIMEITRYSRGFTPPQIISTEES